MIKEADMNGDGQVDYPGVYNVCLMLMITIWSRNKVIILHVSFFYNVVLFL
jgi:hypothetical protein